MMDEKEDNKELNVKDFKLKIEENGESYKSKNNTLEFSSALEELDYMEKHPEEYKSFHSVKELMEDLNSDD